MHLQRCTASLPGIADMHFTLLKCIETHETTHMHTMNQKIAEYSMKSATRTFYECGANFGTSLHRPNAVALFIEFERATAHERRGMLLECVCEVCFPKACVDGEKIAKDIRLSRTEISGLVKCARQNSPRLAARSLRYILESKSILCNTGVVNKEFLTHC